MNGDTRILICTDAAGMGINIPDIKRVIQWKIFDLLTLATLVQRIGRAGRDTGILAVTVVFVEKRHILVVVYKHSRLSTTAISCLFLLMILLFIFAQMNRVAITVIINLLIRLQISAE